MSTEQPSNPPQPSSPDPSWSAADERVRSGPPAPVGRRVRWWIPVVAIVGLLLIAVAVVLATRMGQGGAGEPQRATVGAADLEGLKSLVIRSETGRVHVVFDDIDAAQLEFTPGDGLGDPRLEHRVRNGTLDVRIEHRPVWPWQWPFGQFTPAALTVRLPDELRGRLLLDLTGSAGRAEVDGEFRDVELELTAGGLELRGSADRLTVTSTAGSLNIVDYRADEVEIESTAGSVDLELSVLPSRISLTSTAGSQRVLLPDGEYRIDAEATAGKVNLDAPSDPDADRIYRFRSTAGSITIERR